MTLTREERETIIRWNQVPGEPCSVYSHDCGLIRELEARGLIADHTYHHQDGTALAKRSLVPRSMLLVRVKTPRAPQTPAQRAATAANFRKTRTLARTGSENSEPGAGAKPDPGCNPGPPTAALKTPTEYVDSDGRTVR